MEKQYNKSLESFKLKPSNYTLEQKEIILEPLLSPETYMGDGTLSAFQAKEQWLNKMRKSGLSPLQRTIILHNILK